MPYNYILNSGNNFQMLYQKQGNKVPKKTAEKLSKFDYYVDTFIPNLFGMKTKTLELQNKVQRPLNQLLSKPGNKSLTYNYFYSECHNSAAVDANSILGSVKKLYLNQDVIKINEMSYSRQSIFKQAYFPVYGFFSQIIDFFLISDKKQKSNNTQKSKTQGVAKSSLNSNQSGSNPKKQTVKTLKSLTKPRQYCLYVIHNCNSFKPDSDDIKKISWQHFIERYHFTDKDPTDPQNFGMIRYELVYSYIPNQSLFSAEQKLTKLFIQSHCKMANCSSLQNLDKLQGYLLQRSSQVHATKQRQTDVVFSDQHRRQAKIPIQHYKHYVALKKQVYKFYLNLHETDSEDQINKYFYENLICRYLIAKDYNFQEAKKLVLEYLKWEKQLKERYPSLDCFKDIHQLGAYRYIGQDFMGRPIILNKAALVDVNQMKDANDVEMYCDYYIYFLEVYLPSKMRGYVDQMVIIGDLDNLGTRNFKLAITKRNVADSLKYGPQRQFALITVNVSTFAYTAWTFIKPLLPKKTWNKIQIVGRDKKQIVDTLITRMDISVIPDYLGGQNEKIQKEDQMQFTHSKKATSAVSKLLRQKTDQTKDQLKKLQLVPIQSEGNQIKKSNSIIFSVFESVTKSLGISLGN